MPDRLQHFIFKDDDEAYAHHRQLGRTENVGLDLSLSYQNQHSNRRTANDTEYGYNASMVQPGCPDQWLPALQSYYRSTPHIPKQQLGRQTVDPYHASKPRVFQRAQTVTPQFHRQYQQLQPPDRSSAVGKPQLRSPIWNESEDDDDHPEEEPRLILPIVAGRSAARNGKAIERWLPDPPTSTEEWYPKRPFTKVDLAQYEDRLNKARQAASLNDRCRSRTRSRSRSLHHQTPGQQTDRRGGRSVYQQTPVAAGAENRSRSRRRISIKHPREAYEGMEREYSDDDQDATPMEYHFRNFYSPAPFRTQGEVSPPIINLVTPDRTSTPRSPVPMKERLARLLKNATPKASKWRKPITLNENPKDELSPEEARQQICADRIISAEARADQEELEKAMFGDVIGLTPERGRRTGTS